MVGIRMHGIVDEGHEHQDDKYHDQVHRVKYSGSNRGLVYNSKHLGARAANLQRDGPRQAGVPDHKAGIGGGNQQGIIHIPYPAGHSLGQQRLAGLLPLIMGIDEKVPLGKTPILNRAKCKFK